MDLTIIDGILELLHLFLIGIGKEEWGLKEVIYFMGKIFVSIMLGMGAWLIIIMFFYLSISWWFRKYHEFFI